MSLRRALLGLLTAFAVLGLLTGCGILLGIQDFSGPASHDGGEIAPNSKSEGGVDARPESATGTEGGVDSGPESATGTEGGVDSGSDSATGAESGDDSDTGAGGGDAGDGSCSVSAADSGLGGTLNWAGRFGKTGATDVASVALDPTSGDVVLTGYLNGTTDFGTGLVTGGDAGGGGFLAKFDATGALEWAHVSDGDVNPFAVAVDGSGNVLFAGVFDGATTFGDGGVTSVGSDDIFLAKFESGGIELWAKHFGAASGSSLRGVAFDASGNIYAVGEPPESALDLGCGALPAGSSEFVAEFDPNGVCLWSNPYGTRTPSNNTQNETLALDPTGNVFVTGGFYGTVDFGTGSKVAPGSGMDVFVQKLSPKGAVLWAKTWGTGALTAQATGAATDCSGNLLLDGTFTQTIDFGCNTLTESGETNNGDIFLAKLDPSGNCVWSESFGDADAQIGGPLAVDGLGGPAITGGFSGTVNFGPDALSGGIEDDTSAMYLAKFNSAGTYDWAYAGGPPASNAINSYGFGIAANAAVVVGTGRFQSGTLSLAGDSLTAVSSQDTYVASFAH
jgi:hypothetical protein